MRSFDILQSTSPAPSGRYFRSRLDVLAVVAAVALGLAVFWMFRFRGWYAHDEGALGQAAERILRGQVPHRDFDDPYTGGLAYLHAMVFRFGGIGTSALRNHLALVASVWFAGVFWLLTHWLRPVGAALVAALIAVWTLPLYPAAMPSWYILFLTCAAGGALVHWHRRVYLAAGIAGVLIGLAALAKINAAFALSGAVFALVAMRQSEDIKRRAGIEVIVATAVFGALVMRLVSSLLDARVFAHLALPAFAIVAGIAWREVKHGQSHGFGIDIELWRRIAVLMIAAAIPIGTYAFWLAQHGALVPFLASASAVMGRRAASAAMPPPTVGSIINALPFLAVLLASNAQLRIRPMVIAGAGIVLGILAWFYPEVHADIWEGLRGMLPAGAMLYCWAWPGSLPTADSPARRALTVFAPIAAIMALTQYPFSATIYFVYVLPLLVLALSAAVALRPPTTQRSAALLAFLLVLFAVTEVISNVAIRAGIMSDLEDMRANIFDLFQLIAQQELKSNIAQTDTQTKLGVFVDAFKDDSQRDHGTAQTAAIVSGFLTLPLATVASFPDGAANLINQTLPFTPVVAIAQPMVTQCAIINAYVNLSPLDGTIKLNPFSDSWSVYVSQYTSQLTTLIVQSGLIAHLDPVDARSVRRRQQLAGATTAVEVVTPSQINQELTKTTTTGIACRQLPIAVSMAGFMPGEKIIEATFDGVSLASLINVTAGLGGAMTGSFTIPAGVPTGIKLVSVLGDLGTTASTTYSASFNVLPGLPPPPVPQYIDPLAQTFVPDEDMQVCAVDVKFCKKGPTLAPVLVQIRDVVNGYPGPTAFCSQSVPVSAMNVLDTITVAATLSSCGSINNIAPTTQIVPPAQGEVGFHQNGNLRHVWAKFNLPSDLAGSTVSSARLTMRLYHSTPVTTLGGNPRPFFVTASRLTESFDPASVSWNVRQNGQAWTTPGGTYNSEATDGNSLMPTPLTTPRPPFWQANDLNPDAYNIMVSWDVSNIVEEWAGGVVNNGILLRGAREQFRTTQTLAALAYFDFAGFSPTLEITYKPVSSGLLGEGWTRVAFDVPTFVKGGTQYALTLLTSDPGHSVSFARLGDMMEANNNNGTAGLVVQNPYGPGVLFDSPNNATWIARPKDDLTFRILRASYNPTTSAVNLGNVAATTATDFIVRALIGRFSGDTIINFNVTPPGGTATKVENGQTLPLTAQVSGNFAVQAEISGTEKLSPILYANTIGVVGTLSSPGTYASIRVSSAQTFTAHVILQAFLPSGSTVLVQVATATYAGGSRVVVDGVHQFTWAEMTLDTTTAADNGYVQQVWSLTGVKGVTLQNVSQVKVTLAGSPSARLLAKGLQFYTK